MRCQYPKPLKAVRFVQNSPSFYQLNISRTDIPCVLENDGEEAARSTQPVTLYIAVNITPPNLHNSPPTIPTQYDDSPTEKATVLGHIQSPSPEQPLPLSHQQPVETSDTTPQDREETSPTSNKNPRSALHQADESMTLIPPIDRSKTWERAVGRVKWVLDKLSPIAEVRVMPF